MNCKFKVGDKVVIERTNTLSSFATRNPGKICTIKYIISITDNSYKLVEEDIFTGGVWEHELKPHVYPLNLKSNIERVLFSIKVNNKS